MVIGDSQICEDVLTLSQKLAEEFASKKWDSITLCSAFLTERAANDIMAMTDKSVFHKDTQITFLVGTKQYFTEPDAIKMLIEYKENNSNPNLTIKVLRPEEMEFHLKCYIFHCRKSQKALVGSANLTSIGLASKGEIMIEVDNLKTVEEISLYVNCFLNRSVAWEECIDEYVELYGKYRPTFEDTNHFRKSANKSFNYKLRKRIPVKFTPKYVIKYAAPTSDSLSRINATVDARINNLYEELKRQGKYLNKSNSIIYQHCDKNEMLEEYQEGFSFDRAWGTGYDGWEIGKERAICVIGAVGVTECDEVVIYMKPRSHIRYKVTQKIIDKAEEYNIKSKTPTQENLDRYKHFIERQLK